MTVRNTGARPGREVVQVYAGPGDAATPDRPVRWLAGFAAAEAGPGEAVTVTVELPERTFQLWDGGWVSVPGEYRIEAAHSIDDRPLQAALTVG